MDLIGRENERKIFKQHMQSKQSKLIALYGRRRIGKTYLVRAHFKKEMRFEIAGLYKGDMFDQLRHFATTLAKAGYMEALISPPDNWLSAFDMLSLFIDRMKDKRKKVLFIDELPWFDTPRSKFLMAFENFWNSYCTKRKDIVLIICGSAASWMLLNIIQNKGGLHNRVSQHIQLSPFTLYETEKFLRYKGIKWSSYDIIQLYMCTGGIPYYLEYIQKGESFSQFINRACFEKNGPLYNEYDELYSSLFKNSTQHEKIVKILASKKTGFTRKELIKKTKINSGGTLSNILFELEKSGFITKENTYHGQVNGVHYTLTDLFTIFYWKFMIKKNKRILMDWNTVTSSQSWKSWSGFAFERLCFSHQNQLKKALHLQAIATEFSTWSNKNAQIDLVISRADRIVHVCEIKFSRSEFEITSPYAKNLRNKMDQFQREPSNSRQVLFLTMITTYGTKENRYHSELVQNEITLKDLFVS